MMMINKEAGFSEQWQTYSKMASFWSSSAASTCWWSSSWHEGVSLPSSLSSLVLSSSSWAPDFYRSKYENKVGIDMQTRNDTSMLLDFDWSCCWWPKKKKGDQNERVRPNARYSMTNLFSDTNQTSSSSESPPMRDESPTKMKHFTHPTENVPSSNM